MKCTPEVTRSMKSIVLLSSNYASRAAVRQIYVWNVKLIRQNYTAPANGFAIPLSYYWLKNKLWPHKILQIPNVGILSTIQWRFYNAKRFAVIPEWQMEKKLQFISDRIAGQLSKQSIKKQMETICRTFCVQIRSRRYERLIFCGNFAFQFCLFVVL